MRTYNLLVLLAMAGPLCLAQTPAPAPAKPTPDVLVFTNGDQLTGKLQSASGGKVQFHSDMAGDVTVSFDKVKELRSGSEFVALKAAARPGKYDRVASGTVEFSQGAVTLTPSPAGPAPAAPQTLAAKDLSYLVDVPSYSKEVDHRGDWRYGWAGSATAGLTMVRSTQTSTTFAGALNLVRQIPTVPYLERNHRTTIDVTDTYGTNSTPVIPPTVPASPAVEVKTHIFHADAERDQYFTPRLFALADVGFDHNFASGLQLQQIYGVGVGWTPLQDAVQQLDLKGDVHYEKQQFLQTASVVTASTDLFGSTFQENYRRTLPRKLVFTEWANIIPAWNDFVAYSANAYLGLAMPLYKRLNVSLSATDNYLNNPAPFYRTNTVQFVTGVTYTFK